MCMHMIMCVVYPSDCVLWAMTGEPEERRNGGAGKDELEAPRPPKIREEAAG